MTEPVPRPARTLSIADACFLIVGIVVGAGIFKTPSLVAANSTSDAMMLALWLAGGAVALAGALCYAELASAYPNAGGEYHFLHRAFGGRVSFLFAWSRLTVIQTGSIALLAFVFGDYATELAPLGEYSSAIYAALAIAIFTAINIKGIREGAGAQRLFTIVEVGGVLLIAAICLVLADSIPDASAITPVSAGDPPTPTAAALGFAMVFVLLTYGGWNEGVYVSAEVRGTRAPIAWALIFSIFIITIIYLLANLAYLSILGRQGMAFSQAVAADALRQVWGSGGVAFVGALVAVSSLTSMNATIITGARCNFALGQDFPLFGVLGRWNSRGGTPTAALLAQGVIALLLVLLGAAVRSGFTAIVEYTAPVFWLFCFLTGVALFILRWRDVTTPRPFRVPLYPLTPIVFCASAAYMFWSSISYAGRGALIGVAVLLAGLPVTWFLYKRKSPPHSRGDSDEYAHPVVRPAREPRLSD